MVVESGGVVHAAGRLGVSPGGLSHQLRKRGLMSRVSKGTRRLAKPEPLPDVVSELDMLKQRNKELEGELRRRREGDVFEERLLLRLEDAVRSRGPSEIRRPQRSAQRHLKRDRPHEFALLFSDTHAGEVVRSEETLGMNEYRWEIMLQRMRRIQESVISYQQHRAFPVRRLHVWALGDCLSGSIHPELAITNELPDEEATVQFGYDFAQWLEGFLPFFETVCVAGVPGNHPRRSVKPQAKMAHNNSDWTAYKIVELYHRNTPRLSFSFPRAAYATTVVAENWRVLLMHGDGIRSSMPGVPWGGVVRRVTTLEQQFAKAKLPLDYVCLGHFHTANSLDGVGVKTFLNGSVKGLDEYSLKQFGSGRAPSQLLLTFHPERGWTDTSSLDCERVVPAGAARLEVAA